MKIPDDSYVKITSAVVDEDTDALEQALNELLEIPVAILKYKGYEGTAELDLSLGICRGKILFIKDLVTYQSAMPERLEKEFQEAVDDYLETIRQIDQEQAK